MIAKITGDKQLNMQKEKALVFKVPENDITGTEENFVVIDTETNWHDKVMSIGIVVANVDTFQMAAVRYYVITPEELVGGMYSGAMRLKNDEFFTKRDAMEILDLNAQQAGILLKHMIEERELLRISKGKTTRYIKYQENVVKLSPYSQEEKVLKLAEDNGSISNDEVRELLGVSAGSVNVLLSGMVKKGILQRISRGVYGEVRKGWADEENC